MMLAQADKDSDRLVRFSRRSLWTALLLVVFLGAYSFPIIAFPESPAAVFAVQFAKLYPIVIVIAGLALYSPKAPSSREMQLVLNDELRQLSSNRAYRNCCLAMLVVQPLWLLLLPALPAAHPAALMASGTAITGVLVLLASILYYDR